MNIDIYSHTRKRYIAVPKGNVIPESWADAKFFKTIELRPGEVRIGLGNADDILAAIEKDGHADLGAFGGA